MARTELFGSFDVYWPAKQGELVQRPPAKRAAQNPILSESPEPSSPSRSAGVEKMPDGCESAFTPYVAPRMANVSGRGVSTRSPFRVDFGHRHRRLPEREAALAF
jgi:hypothetical protein